jgi:hypothetical protein
MLILTSNMPLSSFDYAVRDRIDEVWGLGRILLVFWRVRTRAAGNFTFALDALHGFIGNCTLYLTIESCPIM